MSIETYNGYVVNYQNGIGEIIGYLKDSNHFTNIGYTREEKAWKYADRIPYTGEFYAGPGIKHHTDMYMKPYVDAGVI